MIHIHFSNFLHLPNKRSHIRVNANLHTSSHNSWWEITHLMRQIYGHFLETTLEANKSTQHLHWQHTRYVWSTNKLSGQNKNSQSYDFVKYKVFQHSPRRILIDILVASVTFQCYCIIVLLYCQCTVRMIYSTMEHVQHNTQETLTI